MVPARLAPLFWDVRLDSFDPRAHAAYVIGRVLELGDRDAIGWMRETFTEAEIVSVLRSERRLSPRSANFWALLYPCPPATWPRCPLPSEASMADDLDSREHLL